LHAANEASGNGRFWGHAIRDEADYAEPMDYCHINPVNHGFVQKKGARLD
jgi:REP element-mobilizing transposase RayT